jgi:hypothetical protein
MQEWTKIARASIKILLVILLVGMLSACGSSEEGSSENGIASCGSSDSTECEPDHSDKDCMGCEVFKTLMNDVVRRTINVAFTKVYLINGEPNTTRRKITDKYGFYSTWEGTSGNCGIITVFVPKERCTRALLNALKEYDPLLGALGMNDEPRTYPTID